MNFGNREKEKDNVIGVYGDRQLLSMVTEESLLSTISQVIGRREDEATLISSISGIDVFSPFVEPYDSDNNVYRVRLCDYNDFDLNNMAKILFEQSCEAAGIKIHSKVRFTTDMTIYRVTIDNLEQLNAMGEFESVYSAEKTYPIMATMDILDSDNVVVVKQPEETEEYPVVGVLDTGIADMCVNSTALDLRQRIESVPQTKKGFHSFKELLRGRLMQASGILNPVIAVQRILRLVPGEPPLVGHFITGIGLEYLGNLVRNFDKLILRVPIIKIFQIDSSHRKILHFSLFGVGRKRNGVMAENGTAPRDTLSRSLESKIRLRDTRPHKRTKIYYRLCTV